MSDLSMIGPGPMDWPEDYSDENGQYQCECTTCGKLFIGHKRRITCKLCAAPSAPDAVRELFAALRVNILRRDDPEANEAAMALITAHVAKETAALTAKVERLRGPTIVCLCGSTRFMEAFQAANLRETIAGRIVLSVGCNTKSDADLAALGQLTAEAKAALDELHKRKIDLSDEVLVLNVGGYIGESTRSEIAYAKVHGKPIRYLESTAALADEEVKP